MTRDTRTLFSAALLMGAFAQGAAAAGAPPGEIVSNSMTLSYETGGDTITQEEAAEASFTVDQRLSFTFASLEDGGTVNVEPGAAAQEIRLILTNTGNAAVPFDIDVAAVADQLGLTLDPGGGGEEGTYSVFLLDEPGGTAVAYDPSGVVSTGPIPADGSRIVVIRATIPRSAGDGALTSFEVSAAPLTPNGSGTQGAVRGQGLGAVDIVYGDEGEDGTVLSETSYQVLAPQLTAAKDVIVVSENRTGEFSCSGGAPEPEAEAFIPGACIEYTITLSNAPEAGSPATFLQFNDTLPEGVTFDSVAVNNGFDELDVEGAMISGAVATLAPGSSAFVRIRATVD